jgi:hypothetical protein
VVEAGGGDSILKSAGGLVLLPVSKDTKSRRVHGPGAAWLGTVNSQWIHLVWFRRFVFLTQSVTKEYTPPSASTKVEPGSENHVSTQSPETFTPTDAPGGADDGVNVNVSARAGVAVPSIMINVKLTAANARTSKRTLPDRRSATLPPPPTPAHIGTYAPPAGRTYCRIWAVGLPGSPTYCRVFGDA